MKIKVGDSVKFLNDTGSGTVKRIIDQKTALVKVEGGFEVPWMINELVVDSGSYSGDEEREDNTNFNEDTEKKSFSESVGSTEETLVIEDEEVIMAFVPSASSSEFDVFLVNSSSYRLKFTISRQQEGELILFSEDSLEPGLKINLGTYQPGNLNEEEYFRIQALFYNSGFYRHVEPMDLLIKLSASELYNSANHEANDYFHNKAMLHRLYDWKKTDSAEKWEIDPDELKKALYTKGDVKEEQAKPKKKLAEEVDLHIQEITDNYRNLDNGEILELQISRFRTILESAILHKSRRVVFIHGVGNGKLKHEIRRIIEREYKNVNYQDASFKEYGYGATMAIIG